MCSKKEKGALSDGKKTGSLNKDNEESTILVDVEKEIGRLKSISAQVIFCKETAKNLLKRSKKQRLCDILPNEDFVAIASVGKSQTVYFLFTKKRNLWKVDFKTFKNNQVKSLGSLSRIDLSQLVLLSMKDKRLKQIDANYCY